MKILILNSVALVRPVLQKYKCIGWRKDEPLICFTTIAQITNYDYRPSLSTMTGQKLWRHY